MQYVVHYDIAAIVIILTIILHFENKRTIYTRFTMSLKVLLRIVLLSAVLDLLTSLTISYSDYVPVVLNYVLNQALHLSFVASTMVYYVYMIYFTKEPGEITLKDRLLMFVPAGLAVVLVLTTSFTGLVIYFDEAGHYHRGSLIWLVYAISAFYTLLALLHTRHYRSRLTIAQKRVILFFSTGTMVAIFVQILYAHLMIVYFMMAIVCLLVYLSMENPEDYTEKRFGTFNQPAFVEVMSEHFDKRRKFQVLGIRIGGLQYLKETVGVGYAEIVLKEVAEYLMKIAGKNDVYYIGEERFGILGKREQSDWERMIEDVREHFRQPVYINKLELSVSVSMAMIAYPNNVEQLEDALDMLSFSLNKAAENNSELVVYEHMESLSEARREHQLMQVMKKALKKSSFVVYYQPIFSVKEQRYTSAEALIRLIDPELGFISPDEFIPLAERCGLILEIGEFVFRQVCQFIKDTRIWEKGINFIDVNLSAVQCMQEHLYKQLVAIMDEYELDYSYINLEITETAALYSGGAFQNNMTKLMECGVKFSLDDYGTGYSNLENLIKYPFYTIKLDKSMVWGAMESDKAMCALKHTISMINEMQNLIIAEGVETEEQAQMLAEMGCHYFQGYYYSKPVNTKDFLVKLEENSGG